MDPAHNEEDFEELVRSALDELPDEFQKALDDVVVVVSERGEEYHAYGLYVGARVAGRNIVANVPSALPDEILIFRDTIVRDFGPDPNKLREEVRRVVRHEVGHHLGFDERGVRRLGL